MKICIFLTLCVFAISEAYVDYTGHKVISATPKSEEQLKLLHKLREDYSVDLWNEPRIVGSPVMIHMRPELITGIENLLKEHNIEYDVAFFDLQSAIAAERTLNAPTNTSHAERFDFGKYNRHEQIEQLIKDLSTKYPNLAKLDQVGKSYENRPIYSLRISSGNGATKPAIGMDCGIHSREWSSIAACAYFVNKLVTSYSSDPTVTNLVDKYEFNIIVQANPDGYIYTWNHDRLWRKTRSRSTIDWLGVCPGADANRNFDIDHCGIGTSRKPCEEIYCGDYPFSESETRAVRDLMLKLKDRMKVYFSLHAFSQLWMTPYGISKKLPANYGELTRVGQAGVEALAKKYGTRFKLGTIAKIIYEAAGSSADYAYETLGIKMAFALELRDLGRYGFILPQKDIIPMCEETFDGLVGAILALR